MFAVWGPWISGRAFDCRSRGHRFEPGWALLQDVIARLAQSVERKALNLVVVGSSPTVGAASIFLISPITYNIVEIHSNPILKKIMLVSLNWSGSCYFEI